VDRYVIADARRSADFTTEEVRAAGLSNTPWFDATALRANDRKLGLGSSAAILVASIATDLLDRGGNPNDGSLAQAILPLALKAHAIAQPLGSGIDVVASCFGGTRIAEKCDGSVAHRSIKLPSAICIEIWAAPLPSSTHDMLRMLEEFRHNHARHYANRILKQAEAAELAARSARVGDARSFVSALTAQRFALEALGRDAGLNIVTPEVSALANMAAEESAAVLPAGAGGGDIAVFVGHRPPSDRLRRLLSAHEHAALGVQLGARGVHGVGTGC
jgi:phosphomevalonate kinase